jgi:molybdenum cofactor biosynthesis enzyme MoaA
MCCSNCFSSSGPCTPGHDIDPYHIHNVVLREAEKLIRISLTGGEPLLHSNIGEILEMPERISNCGFVLNTNGVLGKELDNKICDLGWLVAFSVHGREKSHNEYTRSQSFWTVSQRVEKMAQHGIVHIYCVLHDGLDFADIDWLFRLRDEAGVKFLRFITPRNFGRYKPLNNQEILGYVIARLDDRSGLKVDKSLTQFLSVEGCARICN